MFTHPDLMIQHTTEVQRQYRANAEQVRLLAAARKARRRHEHCGEMSGLARIVYALRAATKVQAATKRRRHAATST